MPVSNRRSNPSLENIFGLFVSTVAVRLQHLGESSFREQLVSTREAVSRSVSHSALPFEKIVEELKPERIAGVNPFFQIALSWINTMTIPLDLNGIPGNRTTVNKGNSPFDISFYMWENGGLMTSSGKINRKNLPLPDSSNDRQTLIEPSTETEQRLLELWRALLKTENISTGDNFFDMGGNSILAINLANSVSKEFNVALKSLMIFEYPTIKDQSEFLSGIKEDIISQSNIELEEKIQRKKNVNFRRGRD